MTDTLCCGRTKPCKKSIRWGCVFYSLISSILLNNAIVAFAACVPLLAFLASGHVSKVLPERFMAIYILRSFKGPFITFLQLRIQSGTLEHQMHKVRGATQRTGR